jgi:four helix bundle protein
MKAYTYKRNLNRGYMKLEVWNNGMELFKYCFDFTKKITNLDIKLKSQILDSAQSISSNIAEGYCRRSLNEYLYFLSIAAGSAGELLTRVIGLKEANLLSEKEFEEFDAKHYEVENKLLALIKSLQYKKVDNSWDQKIHETEISYIDIP